MGLLVEGRWQDKWYESKNGSFERTTTAFRDWITPDGTPAPDGRKAFPAEAGRYHLYISLACPWAHRTLIVRRLKKLEDVVSLSVVDFLMGENGWVFSDRPGAIPDSVLGKDRLYEVYTQAKADFTGRVTVPVLWDKKTGTIVNNESAEIIRIFNAGFGALADETVDLAPDALLPEIDAVNARVYDRINNGVYKCGFATTQEAYEAPFHVLFSELDALDALLAGQRYLVGNTITEADWRLFTTLIRFDAVYHGHFKCNARQIADYPNLFPYMLDLYQQPGIAETVNFEHIKGHYYQSHTMINPTAIVPLGPDQDLRQKHGRERFS
ncbi:glutathione S-transferase family protein [Aureimonas glaciei]|uniref:Glutathione-dependent reductase n=1 Tax=Aureimonas glaciei TaxID=1776957 RepID=A0A916Y2K4_9HYPH|nr:glutathione S-transferase family protein [Aureimonas glaciei]GGD28103.1 glutathione-dependent reductase [Aureimonas glaciei]